jgi:hypothetical protein
MSYPIYPVRPYRMTLAGASRSGKTFFVTKLLKDTYNFDRFDKIFIFAPQASLEQKSYRDIEELYGEENVIKFPGMPDDQISVEIFDAIKGDRTAAMEDGRPLYVLCIVDDLMDKMKKGGFVEKICTAESHHLDVSLIFMQQVYFLGTGRTARLNTEYLIAYQLDADKGSFKNLAKQFEPDHSKELYEKFVEVTSKPHTPFIVDIRAQQLKWPPQYRYRAGWWDNGIFFPWYKDVYIAPPPKKEKMEIEKKWFDDSDNGDSDSDGDSGYYK